MFLGLTGERDRDQNVKTCWTMLEIGFKSLFLLSLVLVLFQYIFPNQMIVLANEPQLTIGSLQLWRLISSFLLPSIGKYAIINVLFNFYILYMFMPDQEKKYSTVYIVLQVILQTIFCNVALAAVAYPLIYYQIGNPQYYIGFGMHPAIFVMIWRKVSDDPQLPTSFCWFPCKIPMKYVPLCFLLFYVVTGYIIPVCLYCALGYYQIMIRGKAIIRLPLKVYRKIDQIIPEALRNGSGFVKVVKVETDLRKVCLSGGCCDLEEQESRDDKRVGNKGFVEVIGGGVAIGSSSKGNDKPQNDFKKHWEGQCDEEQTAEKQVVNEKGPQFESDENFGEKNKTVGNEGVVSHQPLNEEHD